MTEIHLALFTEEDKILMREAHELLPTWAHMIVDDDLDRPARDIGTIPEWGYEHFYNEEAHDEDEEAHDVFMTESAKLMFERYDKKGKQHTMNVHECCLLGELYGFTKKYLTHQREYEYDNTKIRAAKLIDINDKTKCLECNKLDFEISNTNISMRDFLRKVLEHTRKKHMDLVTKNKETNDHE